MAPGVDQRLTHYTQELYLRLLSEFREGALLYGELYLTLWRALAIKLREPLEQHRLQLAEHLPGARRDMEREIAQLREAGSLVDVIVPDDETLEVFGVNLMDTSRRIDAAQTGVRQGAIAAETVRSMWNGEA